MANFTLAKNYAPGCALPECTSLVSYHSYRRAKDGSLIFKWKTFCEHHRTVGREAVEIFKKRRGGCENIDARCGFTCNGHNTDCLEIDHWDGNKYNNHQDNLVVLCANCHRKKTKMFHDTTRKYFNRNENFHNWFEEV